jgi:Domain of Unknown Function with PDB structure (DUF3857)
MPRRSCWLAGSALVAALAAGAGAATPVAAATLLRKIVEAEVRADGSIAERTQLEVRLDEAADQAAWSPFAIGFDDHRVLDRVAAWVKHPDGTVEQLRRQHFDTVDVGGHEILHSSEKVRLVRFPPGAPGAVLGLDYERTDHPYFPAGVVALGGHGAAISQLTVRVRHPGGGAGGAAAAGWRWAIQGPTEGLHVSDAPGELLITATGVPRPPQLEHVPTEVRDGPVLRYGWGEPASWEAVGRWYDELARGVPRERAEVRQAARQLLAATPGTVVAAAAAPQPAAAAARRASLERILDFVRREVRYVAVEVGVGGYRPAPPHETLARRWGDCKGKVTLLLDMLAEAGIEAYPALVLADRKGRIDPRFPEPGWFNHMIAALPVDGLAVDADDPVAGGYLFVDPTQERGGAGWLHPADQDQMVLVLRGDRTVLVATPLRPRLEASHLTVDLEVRPDGSAAGKLRLELRGGAAAAEAEALAGERPELTATRTHRLITAWLPGAGVSSVRWASLRGGGVPEVTMTAGITLPSLVAQGEALPADAGGSAAGGGSRWLALAGPRITPAPGLLRDRTAPVVVRPGVLQVTWLLTLPDGWCAAADAGADLDNAAGAFHQSISCAGRLLTVERRSELRLRWIEPAQFPAVAAVSLAEHRATARRLRLDRR